MESTELTLDTVVRARTDLMASELSGTESVMLDVERGAYFGVDGVGRTVWDALELPRSIAELCGMIAALYDAPSDQIEADVISFVDQLLAADLASVEPGS